MTGRLLSRVRGPPRNATALLELHHVDLTDVAASQHHRETSPLAARFIIDGTPRVAVTSEFDAPATGSLSVDYRDVRDDCGVS